MDIAAGLRGLTVEDLEAFPSDDGLRRELIGGVLFVSGAPTRRHQLCLSALYRLLDDHCEAHGGLVLFAPYEVRFSAQDSVQPDLLYVGPGHESHTGEARMTVAPDLVVEVSSPSTRRVDLNEKRALYQREGVGEYWFVDLDADELVAFARRGDRYGPPAVVRPGGTYASTVVADLAVAVDERFLGRHPRLAPPP